MTMAHLALTSYGVAYATSEWRTPTLAYALLGSLLFILGRAATLRPVSDPNRVLIFRLATLHRVAGPGYVLVLPFIDRTDTRLDISERETATIVSDARTADGKRLAARLEVTWRVDASGMDDSRAGFVRGCC